MDTLTAAERSERMKLIKSRDTRPELMLRRLVRGLGHRCKTNRRDVIGSPDIAFIRRKRAIFVHGCFWHRHSCPAGIRIPKSRKAFWRDKFSKNVRRDRSVLKTLRRLGWKTLVVWECELRNAEKVKNKVGKFLHA
jgi:DNA mismatch endonuclease (patch repair protein)